ncbi:MAG TPA: type II secretion system F family protein [Sporichthyaceae bacterium]|nr:type II secretion system F family protein [Sporichthyaceae bacterium]
MSTATQYAYKVKDSRGRLIEGKVEAENEGAVADRLKEMGYRPLEVRLAATGLEREIRFRRPRVKLKELAIFSRQFATMINAGMSMLRTLSILSEQSDSAELKRVLSNVKADVEAGNSLSASFQKHPRAFPPLMISMVKAGEQGGFLDLSMRQIAESFESEVKLHGKVKSAMTYPIVVLVMAVLMVAAMLIFIVPVFSGLFKSLGGRLPFATQVLVDASNDMKYIGPLAALATVATVYLWRKHGKSEQVRNVVDPLKLRMPVFGKLFQKIALARFARTLSTLLKSGVPILAALEITGDSAGNVVIQRALKDVAESVKGGETISGPLRNHSVFPSMVVHMMASGEETGALDEMLGKIAEFYDEQVETMTESLTALIEPLMIAFLGTLIGGMIVALYLPMFDIYNLVGN